MVPRAPALLVCLLLLGAGCLAGPAANGTPTESQPATATPDTDTRETDVVTTADGTDCPYRLGVQAATASQRDRIDRRVAYANLSVVRQQEFRDALESGETELGDRLPETWGAPVLVEYENNAYYAVASVC